MVEAAVMGDMEAVVDSPSRCISTIAHTLGFDDPAYFSRAYAAATGLSPRAFRTQLYGGEE